MKKTLKVFISSTFRELAAEREMAVRVIESLELEAVRTEMVEARPETPVEMCKQLVGDSDVFIGIYGGRYGHVLPGQSVSAAEIEFMQARDAGKDILVYMKDDVQPDTRQESFLRGADDYQGGYLRRPRFRSSTELEQWIKEDLIALLTSRFVTSTQLQRTSVDDQYLAYVAALYGGLSFAGLAQTPSGLSARLPDVFVDPQFRSLSRHQSLGSESLGTGALLSSSKHIAVIGAPGSGKTVLLKHLAYSAAQTRLELESADRMIPILVPLASIAPLLARARVETDLSILIVDFIRARAEPQFGPTVRRAIDSGRALVLLDGLDEIAQSESRRSVSNAVAAFASGFPDVTVLITARPTVAAELPPFPAFELLEWNDRQVVDFVQRWSTALTEHLNLSAGPGLVASDLVNAVMTHQALRELATNPLFLTLIAFLHLQGFRIPARRVELYDAAVRMMIESWDRARSLSHTLPRPFSEKEVDRFLASLAFGMIVRDLLRVSVEEAWSLQAVEGRAQNLTTEETAALLSDFASRSGLLSETAPGRFSFAHRSFQEFFAAKALAFMEEEQALAFVKAHFYDPRYEETIRLALAWTDVRGRAEFVARASEDLIGAAKH